MSNNLSSRCSLNQLSLSQPQHSLRPSLCLKKKATKMKQPQQRQQQRVALTLFSIRFSLRLYSAQKKQQRKRKMEIMMRRRNCYNRPKLISFLLIWPNHAKILRLVFYRNYYLIEIRNFEVSFSCKWKKWCAGIVVPNHAKILRLDFIKFYAFTSVLRGF